MASRVEAATVTGFQRASGVDSKRWSHQAKPVAISITRSSVKASAGVRSIQEPKHPQLAVEPLYQAHPSVTRNVSSISDATGTDHLRW
ncbi:MAG: hypothetical protein EBU88_10905 [Acidobacteria bacterium]|nr:hypothetical protein [Acidobacteriota bacterium]